MNDIGHYPKPEVGMNVTVSAKYFSELTGISEFRSSQILNLKGYRLEKNRHKEAPTYPKDKVDALAAVYIERMIPPSEMEATREDLQRILGVESGTKVRLLMTHKDFPKPHRKFMKVATGAPPINVLLVSDLKAVDVVSLLSDVAGKGKKNKCSDQSISIPKINIDPCFLDFISGRNMVNILVQNNENHPAKNQYS